MNTNNIIGATGPFAPCWGCSWAGWYRSLYYPGLLHLQLWYFLTPDVPTHIRDGTNHLSFDLNFSYCLTKLFTSAVYTLPIHDFVGFDLVKHLVFIFNLWSWIYLFFFCSLLSFYPSYLLNICLIFIMYSLYMICVLIIIII